MSQADTCGQRQLISWKHVCFAFRCGFLEIYVNSTYPLPPVPGVLHAKTVALNRQEKQDFLVGVEERFTLHILFQTQVFSLFLFFLNHSGPVFVSVLQLCSAGEWPWGQWHHTKQPAWPWPEPLLAPHVRLNGGWFHCSLTHCGRLQSLSQICGWNVFVGKLNYVYCTWCWLLFRDGK